MTSSPLFGLSNKRPYLDEAPLVALWSELDSLFGQALLQPLQPLLPLFPHSPPLERRVALWHKGAATQRQSKLWRCLLNLYQRKTQVRQDSVAFQLPIKAEQTDYLKSSAFPLY